MTKAFKPRLPLAAALIGLFPVFQSADAASVASPNGEIVLNCDTDAAGIASYEVLFHGKPVILPSALGFSFTDGSAIADKLEIVDEVRHSFSETYELPWGERRLVENTYNELELTLRQKEAPGLLFTLAFRVYDDGLGFRYEFPEQNGVKALEIADENTQFRFADDPMCWWIPGDWDCYEHLYKKTRLSEIDALDREGLNKPLSSTIPENSVDTPVTMLTSDGVHLSLHEASLLNYSGMTLRVSPQEHMLQSSLVGSRRTEWKARCELPFSTPWRTIQISDTAGGLIDSCLIINLNEPNKLGDVSDYVRPMKYVGIWWEMHLDRNTWAYEGGRHGATTENAKKLIDFASKNNIEGLLVEGWNTGWENWTDPEAREGIFDFTTSYPDYDLAEVARYGKEKGVELIMHHETSAAITTYIDRMDAAFGLMRDLDLHCVKTGHVGDIIPVGEYHHGQWMVNFYQSVYEKAAEYRIAINAHEPIKPTGIRRTYPNAISREGARGQEYNAWSPGSNQPDHVPNLVYTRLLAGPMDYTPGVFNIKLKPYKPDNQLNSTLVKELALYVVLYSPIQMVVDLPEYYEGEPAFQFIRDVPCDWEESHTLNGEVGQYVTIARRERGGDAWFIGSVSDEKPRHFELKLDFLPEGKSYRMVKYADAEDAHWDKNPCAYTITRSIVTRESVLTLDLAPGGGAAVALEPID